MNISTKVGAMINPVYRERIEVKWMGLVLIKETQQSSLTLRLGEDETAVYEVETVSPDN